MSKEHYSIIQKREVRGVVDGFTPVFDVIIYELKPVDALVYGVMWRYCQMKDGLCYASQETIAERSGVTRQTVNQAIKRLIVAGYLTDTTPELEGQPHEYCLTNKIEMILHADITSKVASPEEQTKSKGTCQKTLQGVSKNFTATCKNFLHKDTIKDTNKRYTLENLKGEERYLIDEFLKLWKMPPPSGIEINYWRRGIREFIYVCEKHEPRKIMGKVYERWLREDMPYEVSSPNSIVRSARSIISRLQHSKKFTGPDGEIIDD